MVRVGSILCYSDAPDVGGVVAVNVDDGVEVPGPAYQVGGVCGINDDEIGSESSSEE